MRIGLVGCGNIGKVHAIAIDRLEKAELCAFADSNIEHAKDYSEKFTNGYARTYISLSEMIEKEELDSIHICTPHNCHVPMAIEVLKYNIHAFVEKPPAINKEEFIQLKNIESESKATIGFCFQNRYNATTRKVDTLIADILGPVKGGRAFLTWNRNSPYYTESNWRGSLEMEGGGVLINQAIHTLDLILRWMGIPIKVEATIQNHHLKEYIEVEDTMEAYLEFSKGENPIRALFYATNAYVSDEAILIELICENGFVRLEGNQVSYRTKSDTQPIYWKEETKNVLGKEYWGNGHEACIHDFYICLNKRIPYTNDLHSVEVTFETVINLYDSARRIK